MSAHWKILVVDDEPLNLEIIAEHLDGSDFQLGLFPSGDAAWQHLQEVGAGAYDLMLLDRMMPGMDGIQLLKLLKADRRFVTMPVVMQTAAAAPHEVREGIAAGAFYYLAKPYSANALMAIVRSALADLPSRDDVAAIQPAISVPAGLPTNGARFEFTTLTEARALAKRLAAMCPQPELTALGLGELLVNAVEHGNLGISYTEKTLLRLRDCWEEEVERRLALPEFAERQACVQIDYSPQWVRFTVSDCGPGFDWKKYMEIDPLRAYDPNGRGIAMARQLAFTSLEYQGVGNVAVATVVLPEHPKKGNEPSHG